MSPPAGTALVACAMLTTLAARCESAPGSGRADTAAAAGAAAGGGTPPPAAVGGSAAAPPDTGGEPLPESLVAAPAPRGRPSAAPAPSSQPATMRPLAESAHLFTSQDSQTDEPGVRVLRDRAAWEAAWRQLQAGLAAGPAPAVDFAREMVVVVAAGQKSSGGHAVRVDGTSTAPDGALVLHVTATAPGEGCMSTMALTSPVDVVRVPRAPGAVRTVTAPRRRTLLRSPGAPHRRSHEMTRGGQARSGLPPLVHAPGGRRVGRPSGATAARDHEHAGQPGGEQGVRPRLGHHLGHHVGELVGDRRALRDAERARALVPDHRRERAPRRAEHQRRQQGRLLAADERRGPGW
jgi:hypothetical protein